MYRFAKLLAAFALCLCAFAAFAGPKEDIQADMHAGRWSQADIRLETVLQEHPQNPLAHYWRAQTRAKLGDLAGARDSLAAAKRIDPTHKFVGNPETLVRLEAQLGPQDVEPVAPSSGNSGGAAPPEDAAPVAGIFIPTISTSTVVLGVLGMVLLAVLFAVFLSYFEVKADSRKVMGIWRANLKAAKSDLDDANTVNDLDPELSPEQRMANHVRIARALQEISSQLAQVENTKSHLQAGSVVSRAHHIAADVRGEETPTARRDRIRAESVAEREAARQELLRRPAPAPSYAPAPPTQSSGSGIETAILGGIAGYALGALASSPPAAAATMPDDSFAVDTGGSSQGLDVDTGGTVASGDSSFS